MSAPHPLREPDEFRAWTILYLDRELSAADEREFAALLRDSEEARQAFAEAAQFDAQLHELRSQEELRASSRRLTAITSRRRTDQTAWVAGLAAAAVLLVILLVAVFSSPSGRTSAPGRLQAKAPVVEPEPAVPVPAPPVPREVPPPPTQDHFLIPLPEPERPVVPPSPEAPRETPPPRKVEPAPPVERRPSPTLTHIGRLESVQGQVTLIAGKNRSDAKAGQDLLPGQGLQTSRDAQAVFVYADGTRLELGADALLRDLAELPHKQATLAQGTLTADVVRQPSGQPMRLGTPAADLLIIGTKFAVSAEAKSTKLHVKEGLVRLSRRKDGQALDVVGGHAATVADGAEFNARPIHPAVLLKGRSAADLEALYLFTEGKGGVVEDVSGAGDAVDLKVKDETAVRWLPRGLLVYQPTSLVSTNAAARITEACRKSHEVTVEAWITPAFANQAGPARILSLSASPAVRAFMLGQGEDKGPSLSRYTFRLRTTGTNENGMPPFISDEGVVRVAPTHLVVTRARSGQEVFYVDGVERGHQGLGGDFSKWTRDCRLTLADEASTDGGQPWLGAYYLVAIYSRALPVDEVAQHFKAGPAPARLK